MVQMCIISVDGPNDGISGINGVQFCFHQLDLISGKGARFHELRRVSFLVFPFNPADPFIKTNAQD